MVDLPGTLSTIILHYFNLSLSILRILYLFGVKLVRFINDVPFFLENEISNYFGAKSEAKSFDEKECVILLISWLLLFFLWNEGLDPSVIWKDDKWARETKCLKWEKGNKIGIQLTFQLETILHESHSPSPGQYLTLIVELMWDLISKNSLYGFPITNTISGYTN